MMTIFGWDASDYDWSRGPMDLAAARRDGIDFFTHKASEGTSVRHSHYGQALARARDAGIPCLGAYHVVRSPMNASAEVDYFLAYVNQATPWWRDFPNFFWQVDLEKWPYDSVPAAEGEQFADIVQDRTGRKAVIYASKGQYGDALSGTSHPLWNANYGGNASGNFKTVYANRGGDSCAGWVTYSGVMPAILQYGSRTTIGSQGTCDANAFRGSLNDFIALIGGNGTDDMTPEQDAKLNTLFELLVNGVRTQGSFTYTPAGGESQPINALYNYVWQAIRAGQHAEEAAKAIVPGGGSCNMSVTLSQDQLDAIAARVLDDLKGRL